MHGKKRNEHCAVVIGAYVNSYSIIQELHSHGVRNIYVVSSKRQLASYSNKVSHFFKSKTDSASLLRILKSLNKRFNKIVIYPTNDKDVIELSKIHGQINDYCYIPQSVNLNQLLEKTYQYDFCKKNEVPVPITFYLNSVNDLTNPIDIKFPILIKPSNKNKGVESFRAKIIYSQPEYDELKEYLRSLLEKNFTILISEYIPGPDSNIYSYACYINKRGEIVSEWQGRKLSQFPEKFGVFASASNEASDKVQELGRMLSVELGIDGISESEFKYDERDNTFKLMEITLRPTMWHRIGYLSGVSMLYDYYLDGIGNKPQMRKQNIRTRYHYIYLTKEIVNILTRWGYFKYFYNTILNADKVSFAVFDKGDLKPFLYDIIRNTSKDFIKKLFVKNW